MDRKKLRRRLSRVALAIGLVSALALLFVKVRYGRGAPYPDLSTNPRVAPADVRSLVTLDVPPGNVTVSRDGRIFFNTHPFAQAHRFADATMFELVSGTPRPYPDLASQPDLRFVFGMTCDDQNRLWLTAPATLDRSKTRIFAFDLATQQRVVDHELPEGVARFGQDLRITPDGKTLLFADTGAFRLTHGALVAVDLATWKARELLATDPSTQAQNWTIQARGAPYRIGYGLLSFQVGADGIALSKDGTLVYFGAMSNDTLHRIRLSDLRDESLSPMELAARVERVGRKPLSDGIETLANGSVLVTDVEHGGLALVDSKGELSTLVKLPGVVWADGVAVTPDGEVLFTDSGIPAYIDPLLRPPSRARISEAAPYHIYAFRMP